MKEKRGKILAPQPLPAEEAIHQSLDLLADQLRHILRQHDVEAGIAQVKTHGVQRIRKQKTLRRQDSWPLSVTPGDHDAGRTIAEQDRRDQVGLRKILALKRQRG